jgi:hypothetical protein
MELYRLFADENFLGNFLIGFAGKDQLKNFQFTRGEVR